MTMAMLIRWLVFAIGLVLAYAIQLGRGEYELYLSIAVLSATLIIGEILARRISNL